MSRGVKIVWALLWMATWALSAPLAIARADEPAESGASNWLTRLLPGEHERAHRSVRSAFRDIVEEANQSVVRVLVRGEQVALGTIVGGEGDVATKASELREPIVCELSDGRQFRATLVAVHPDYDLALLKIAARDLPVARWATGAELPVGSWLATASSDTRGFPAAVGIVSAAARPLPKPRALLGVSLEQVAHAARVTDVRPHTGAAKAGMRVGDVVTNVDGAATTTPQQVTQAVLRRLPGDVVKLRLMRDGQARDLDAVLSDRSRIGNEEQAELMDSLGGPLSQRRAGFPYVLQHDTVLRPRECGGPVVDLDGRVVGINIARVSRVATYALPAASIRPLLADMMAGKYPATTETVAVQAAAAGGE